MQWEGIEKSPTPNTELLECREALRADFTQASSKACSSKATADFQTDDLNLAQQMEINYPEQDSC